MDATTGLGAWLRITHCCRQHPNRFSSQSHYHGCHTSCLQEGVGGWALGCPRNSKVLQDRAPGEIPWKQWSFPRLGLLSWEERLSCKMQGRFGLAACVSTASEDQSRVPRMTPPPQWDCTCVHLHSPGPTRQLYRGGDYTVCPARFSPQPRERLPVFPQ